MPKRTKYRRPHRVKYEGKAKGGKTVAFGDFGLVAPVSYTHLTLPTN